MKNVKLIIFAVIFILGIALILNSDSWNFGSVQGMTIAGIIVSLLGGVCAWSEIYIKRNKQ